MKQPLLGLLLVRAVQPEHGGGCVPQCLGWFASHKVTHRGVCVPWVICSSWQASQSLTGGLCTSFPLCGLQITEILAWNPITNEESLIVPLKSLWKRLRPSLHAGCAVCRSASSKRTLHTEVPSFANHRGESLGVPVTRITKPEVYLILLHLTEAECLPFVQRLLPSVMHKH